MPPRLARNFPLFPLGIVALPTENVPLHIFEERYRVMIEHCLQAEPGSQESQFGIVWLSDEELKPVGCACEIERGARADGRRAHEHPRPRHAPVPAARAARTTSRTRPARSSSWRRPRRIPTTRRPAGARELYRDLVAQATDRELSEDELLEFDAYGMAATVEFGVEAKQELLELRSENARLRLLTMLLSAAIERLDPLERAQARALSNGKVRFA